MYDVGLVKVCMKLHRFQHMSLLVSSWIYFSGVRPRTIKDPQPHVWCRRCTSVYELEYIPAYFLTGRLLNLFFWGSAQDDAAPTAITGSKFNSAWNYVNPQDFMQVLVHDACTCKQFNICHKAARRDFCSHYVEGEPELPCPLWGEKSDNSTNGK